MYRSIQIVLAVVLAGMLVVGPASAAPAGSVVGNGTPLSCTESAFDTALSAGGTITFDCGGPKTIKLSSTKTIGQDTTLNGGDVITLTDTDVSNRLFNVSSGATLALKSIALNDAFAVGSDGGAISNAGTLTLDDTRISNSAAGDNNGGGAIFTTGPVTIHNSHLFNNSAGMGGAIYALGSKAQLVIDHTTFDSNDAHNAGNAIGGAIWVGEQAQASITGGSITNNAAQTGGGLYLSQGATLTLGSAGAPAVVSGNSATNTGGGIELGAGAQLTMTGGSLSSNQAGVQGGALDMVAGASALFAPGGLGGTSISSNYAPDYGGAISNNGGQLTLQGANVSFNRTLTGTLGVGYGGAIDDEGAMVVDDSTFNTNQGRFGGAVFVGGFVFNASADIQQTLFIANIAGQLGGGLYTNNVTTTVTIEDSNFEFNTAAYGGGLARTNAHLSLSRSSVTSNMAQNGGGLGLLAVPYPTDGPYVEIHDSTVSGNLNASPYGAGINNAGLLDLVNVSVANNHARPGFAAIGLFDTITGTIVRLQNTVLDAPPGGSNCSSDYGADLPSSAGFNYSTDTSCGLSGFHDTQGNGLNAMLGPLTHAGSFTDYQMPQLGSPLIDNAGPGCSPADQRYALRHNGCDIGAVESDGLLPRIFAPLVQR